MTLSAIVANAQENDKALKKDNKELKDLLSMQKDLIKRLQEDIKKSAKNSAKVEHDSKPRSIKSIEI